MTSFSDLGAADRHVISAGRTGGDRLPELRFFAAGARLRGAPARRWCCRSELLERRIQLGQLCARSARRVDRSGEPRLRHVPTNGRRHETGVGRKRVDGHSERLGDRKNGTEPRIGPPTVFQSRHNVLLNPERPGQLGLGHPHAGARVLDRSPQGRAGSRHCLANVARANKSALLQMVL